MKWRQYELIIASTLSILAIINYSLYYIGLPHDYIQAAYADFFKKIDHPFNYISDILIPQIVGVLIFYLSYLYIGFWVVPDFFAKRKKNRIIYLSTIAQSTLVCFTCALGINAINYFAHTELGYGVYGFFGVFGNNNEPMSNIFTGIDKAAIWLTIFLGYAIAREWCIYKIEASTSEVNKNHRISKVNEIVAAITICISIPAVAWGFLLFVNEQYLFTLYLLFIVPGLIIYLTTTYLFLPVLGNQLNLKLVSIFILATLFCTVLFFWFFTRMGFNDNLWLISWGGQLCVICPVAWFLYDVRMIKLTKEIS